MNEPLKPNIRTRWGFLNHVFVALYMTGIVACGGGGGNNDGSSVSPTVSEAALPPVGQLDLMLGGVGGPGNVDGAGSQARFNQPFGVVADAAGNLLVSDQGNATIRKVSPIGEVTTLAGKAGETGQIDGPPHVARFTAPGAMALDAAGSLWVADAKRIRKIMPNGSVSTVFQDVLPVESLAVDRNGQIFGVLERPGFGCSSPRLPCVSRWSVVKLVSSSGQASWVETVAGLEAVNPNANSPGDFMAVANDRHNNVFVVRLQQLGEKAGLFDFYQMNSLGAFEQVNLPESARRIDNVMCETCLGYVAQRRLSFAPTENASFRVLWESGFSSVHTTVIAEFFRNGDAPIFTRSDKTVSSNGPLNQAGFRMPVGIAVNATGRLFVADSGNHSIRSIDLSGQVTTLAGVEPDTSLQDRLQAGKTEIDKLGAIPFCNVVLAGNGVDVYAEFCRPVMSRLSYTTLAPTSREIYRLKAPDNVDALMFGSSRGGSQQFGVHSSGEIFVDGKRYAANGALMSEWFTNAGVMVGGTTGSRSGGVLMAGQSRSSSRYSELYFSQTGKEEPVFLAGKPRRYDDFSPVSDGRGSAASFMNIRALAFDASDTAYVADTHQDIDSDFFHSQIRKISSTGEVKTLAGRPGVWGADDGPGATATFRNAQALTVDRKGNVYVADTGNHTIRKITPEGVVSTVVGQTGKAGVSLGALPARLTSPTGVAIDDDNLLYIATPGAVLRVRMPE